jgi:cytochrome c2
MLAMRHRRNACAIVALAAALLASPARAGHEAGAAYVKDHGYDGPRTCEVCHPGTARAFLDTVHWTHAARTSRVKGADPKVAWGMLNRSYTFCNGNDLANDLKESPPNAAGRTKFSGCSSCHPGDHLSGVGSTGPQAEQAIDCLLCHARDYDYSKRRPRRTSDGRVAMGQDRSTEAAVSVGRPGVKNCMICHESAGGGPLMKRGFAYDASHDVHAAKGMVCADCHRARDHRIPTGLDPNLWASDGVAVSCSDAACHGSKPHRDADYDAHVQRLACQACHVTGVGGAIVKDFVRWNRNETGFFEPSTIERPPLGAAPGYAWHDGSVRNEPHFVGPAATRASPGAKIFPFKVFEGRAYFDRRTGQLLVLDFGPPIATGDTLAGAAAAARTLGLPAYDPVPGWQTVYFGANHLVTRKGALTCEACHSPTGRLDFTSLGYEAAEVQARNLRSPSLWFDRLHAKERARDE